MASHEGINPCFCVCVGVHVLVRVCDEFKAFSRTGIKSQFGQGDIEPFAL